MDTALIINLQKGSEEAFKSVYDQYHKKLYFYFLRKLKSEIASEDLVQDTFIRLWRYRQQLNSELPVSIQLFRMARTLSIDVLRKNAINRVHSVASADISLLADSLQEPFPAESSPAITQIKQSLVYLSPMRRKIIEQRLEGFSNPEIANNLSISQKTVENHLNKAFHQLKKHLEIPLFFLLLFFRY
jgi:RNA polymerase sigma-70 factor (ECF subfamily)